MIYIDCHAHAYLADDLPVLAEKLEFLDGFLPADDPNKWVLVNEGNLESLVAEQEASGIERFVLLPVATKSSRVSELNHWAASAGRDYPACIPFGTLHPLVENPEKDLREAVELGLKGFKLHSMLQRFDLTAKPCLDLLAKINEAGLPVLLDTLSKTGLIEAKPHLAVISSEFTTFATDPVQIAKVAKIYPDLKIIAAHFGCLYGWETIAPLYELPNVYLDLAYVDRLIKPDLAVEIIRNKGANRVLFGTDSPWREILPTKEWFESLDLADDEKKMIASENIIELLNL